MESDLVGPRLSALVAFLKGPCGMTISALRQFFRDVCHLRLSKGFLAKLLHRARGALGDPYEELLLETLDAENRGHGQPLLNHLKLLLEIIHRRDRYATAAGATSGSSCS